MRCSVPVSVFLLSLLQISVYNPTDQAAGRVPVVACGTFGGTIEQQAAFINRMALECDAGTSACTAIALKTLPLRNSTTFQLLSLPANWQLVTRGPPPHQSLFQPCFPMNQQLNTLFSVMMCGFRTLKHYFV
jgi:hypothetical protein